MFPTIQVSAAGGPVWPLDRHKIAREWKNWYSYTINGKYMYHAGTDFAIAKGNNVYATYDGKTYNFTLPKALTINATNNTGW